MHRFSGIFSKSIEDIDFTSRLKFVWLETISYLILEITSIKVLFQGKRSMFMILITAKKNYG